MKNNTQADNARKVQAGILTLHNVSVKDAGRSLSSVYHRERRGLIAPFAEMVRDDQLSASPLSAMKMKGILRDLRNGGLDTLSEAALTQVYNSFGASLENVLAVAKADKRYEDAWKRLITSLEVESPSLKQQLGREVTVASGYSWHYSYFAELLFAPLTVTSVWETYSRDYRDYRRHGLLSMDVSTRIALSDLFFGKDYRLPHLSAQLPADAHLKTEDFEQAIVSDLMTLEGVALNGSMLAANGSISTSALKRVKSQTPIGNFKHECSPWPLDRVEMLCLTYFTIRDKKGADGKKDIDIKQLAKFAVEYMPRLIIGPMFNSFIPGMQGFTKSWTIGSYADNVTGIVQYILTAAKDEWMDMSNFKMQLLCSTIEGNRNYIHLNLFNEEGLRKANLVSKTDKERGIDRIEPIDWFEEVGFKFALHWVKYLCALGMVEIAMDTDTENSGNDPMEGMRYARLTALGRYALDIDTEYTPKSARGASNVEFDGKNGIITVDETSPFQMFLSTVAKRISPTRFRISEETLLSGCKKKAELEQRISNLRTIIDPEKETSLKKIIDEALTHTDCAQHSGGYTLLKLRSNLPGLRELLLSDKELREMTIMAGPMLALVKTHKMDRFTAICASHGYLLE
ncbi:MAG: hypothetical protein K2K75_07415 [Muribaculaceae bacterium]|nr:hypothetical protein [Muribaculaceae bacterium]